MTDSFQISIVGVINFCHEGGGPLQNLSVTGVPEAVLYYADVDILLWSAVTGQRRTNWDVKEAVL